MARKVILTSDLSGDSPARTIEFSFDGVAFEVDLTDAEAQQMREALLPYFDVARATRGTGVNPRSSQVGATAAEVRAWARDAGIDVPSKGRLPNEVLAEFAEQHSARVLRPGKLRP